GRARPIGRNRLATQRRGTSSSTNRSRLVASRSQARAEGCSRAIGKEMMGMKAVGPLVIGAGPSGLAVAYSLQNNTLVLEKEATVGGLCRSIYHRGGVFDIGGHSFHTPHPEVYGIVQRSEEHTSELQSRENHVCRL